METLCALGQTFSNLRQLRGLSLDQCASRLGLSPLLLANAERGVLEPTILAQLAQFYAVDLDELLNGDVAPNMDGGTVFLLHGTFQQFSAIDLSVLAPAMRAGWALTALSAVTGNLSLSLRMTFIPAPPAGPDRIHAAQQGYRFATLVRDALHLPVEPLPDLRALLEEKFGIVVLVSPFRTDGLRAAAILDARRLGAAAILSSDDPDRQSNPILARRYLAHELCHLLFDPNVPNSVRLALDGDLARRFSKTAPDANALLESRANAFAAEFLLPLPGLIHLLGSPSSVKTIVAARAMVDRARLHFGTSWEIAVRHLQNHSFIAQELVYDLLAPELVHDPDDVRRSPALFTTTLPEPDSPSRLLCQLAIRGDISLLQQGDLGLTKVVQKANAEGTRLLREQWDIARYSVLTNINANRLIEATDQIVDYFDNLFMTGELEAVKSALSLLDPTQLPPQVIGGILMITAPSQSQLGDAHRTFFARALDALRDVWRLPDASVRRIQGKYGSR